MCYGRLIFISFHEATERHAGSGASVLCTIFWIPPKAKKSVAICNWRYVILLPGESFRGKDSYFTALDEVEYYIDYANLCRLIIMYLYI